MNIKRSPILFLIAIFTTVSPACSSVSEFTATATPEPTATAAQPPTSTPTLTLVPPSPTPTPFPLGKVDLDSVFIEAGDMPNDLRGTFVIKGTHPGDMFDGLLVPENSMTRYFEKNKHSGFAVILLYQDENDIELAYNHFVDKFREDNVIIISDIGEEASSTDDKYFKFADLVFRRCYSVVFIRITDYIDKDDIVEYAKSLDEALAKVVCP
jgi:hypothetical protein